MSNMRMMSFALTERQLVRKAMGLKFGEKVQVLCEIEVVSVSREPLYAISARADEPAREGFPQFDGKDFVEMFCKHMRITEERSGSNYSRAMRPDDIVTRIEFRKVPGTDNVAFQASLSL